MILAALVASTPLAHAEDTSAHVNNAMWAFDVMDKSLTRILQVPYDAEVTSGQFSSVRDAVCYVSSSIPRGPLACAADSTTCTHGTA